MKCCICNREREDLHIVNLTQEEMTVLKKAALEAVQDSYAYCQACWKVIGDRNQGAQLYKGLMQVNLARFGVRNADAIAERYYQFLVNRAAKKPLS